MYPRVQRVLFAALLGSTAAPVAAQGEQSILEIVENNPDFSTLGELLNLAGFDAFLDDDDVTSTVFAPQNSAFDELSPALVAKLTNPTYLPQLRDVLGYHAVYGAVYSDQLVDGAAVPTENYQSDDVIVTTDPSIMINDANVIPEFDIPAVNGVIHTLDKVLAPPSLTRTVVDIVSADGRLGTLVGALGASGLVGALTGEGPFTVFAPTSEAFEKLPCGLLEQLLADVDSLTKVLLYHVSLSNLASDMLSNMSLETIEGSDVEISVSSDGVMLNDDAMVIDANFIATNGITHVINEVLIPPDLELTSPSKSAKSVKCPKSAKSVKSSKSAKSVKSSKHGKQSKKNKKKKKKKRNKKSIFE